MPSVVYEQARRTYRKRDHSFHRQARRSELTRMSKEAIVPIVERHAVYKSTVSLLLPMDPHLTFQKIGPNCIANKFDLAVSVKDIEAIGVETAERAAVAELGFFGR